MKLEQQVCSLELSKKLKELGVKQESLFYWEITIEGTDEWKVIFTNYEKYAIENKDKYLDIVSAFTVAELGDMLPMRIENPRGTIKYHLYHSRWNNGWVSEYKNDAGTQFKNAFKNEATESNARAKMLVYLLENKLITL